MSVDQVKLGIDDRPCAPSAPQAAQGGGMPVGTGHACAGIQKLISYGGQPGEQLSSNLATLLHHSKVHFKDGNLGLQDGVQDCAGALQDASL